MARAGEPEAKGRAGRGPQRFSRAGTEVHNAFRVREQEDIRVSDECAAQKAALEQKTEEQKTEEVEQLGLALWQKEEVAVKRFELQQRDAQLLEKDEALTMVGAQLQQRETQLREKDAQL